MLHFMEQQDYESPSLETELDDDKSAFERFAEVFTSPSEAFSGLSAARKAPIILWGLLIALIATSFSVVLVSTNADVRDEALQEQLEKMEQARDEGKIDDEAYEQQVEMTTMMMSGAMFIIMGVVFGTIAAVALALIIGLVVYVIIRVMSRDSSNAVSYGAALAATIIAFMISNVESILTSIGIVLTSDLGFRISPTAFLNTENDYLEFALNLVNPFTLWLLFALGTGVALLAQRERTHGIAAIAGVWIAGGLIITAIGTLVSATFGGS